MLNVIQKNNDSEGKENIAANNESNAGVIKMKDASTNPTTENVAEFEAESDIEIITGLVAAAGIVTNVENYENKRTQRRHYSEADEFITNENTAGAKDEEEVEKIEFLAAAGIETKMENYENKRTQQRHFSEADEVIDVIKNSDERDAEFAAETNEEETIKTEEATGVEIIKMVDCESKKIRTERKHFPGTTTSNIFR